MKRPPQSRAKPLTIVDVLDDPKLFKPWFPGDTWGAWLTILKAAFCLPMTDAERKFFRTIAERDPPKRRVKELWVIGGRRGGKDAVTSAIVAYLAGMFTDRDKRLRPGERASVLCLAVDRDQAGVVLGYVKSYFNDLAMLKKKRDKASTFENLMNANSKGHKILENISAELFAIADRLRAFDIALATETQNLRLAELAANKVEQRRVAEAAQADAREFEAQLRLFDKHMRAAMDAWVSAGERHRSMRMNGIVTSPDDDRFRIKTIDVIKTWLLGFPWTKFGDFDLPGWLGIKNATSARFWTAASRIRRPRSMAVAEVRFIKLDGCYR